MFKIGEFPYMNTNKAREKVFVLYNDLKRGILQQPDIKLQHITLKQLFYDEYIPTQMPDGIHYVWQATKKAHYIGPTNVDFTLVWQLGADNYNRKFDKKRDRKTSTKVKDEIIIGGDTIVDDVRNRIETEVEKALEVGDEQ